MPARNGLYAAAKPVLEQPGGSRVVLADLDGERAQAAAANITAEGGVAYGLQADVGSHKSCEAMIQGAVGRFGGLDIAVNNAGIPSTIARSFADYDRDEWQRVMHVNVTGVFNSMMAEVPIMVKAGGGAIVNIASMASFVVAPGMAPYVRANMPSPD